MIKFLRKTQLRIRLVNILMKFNLNQSLNLNLKSATLIKCKREWFCNW